jgi:hypothetical protein
MDDQLEPPPRGINIFAVQWRDWLFRLYRYVLGMGTTDFLLEVKKGNIEGLKKVI